MVSCWDRATTAYTLPPIQRLSRMLIVPVVQAVIDVVDEFAASARAGGGFGSTGR